MSRNKRNDLLSLVLGLVALILLNYIGSFVFLRFDLTSEKRYSISEPTKELLNELEDIVYIKVYLEGSFPADFKRLRNESREMLDEFKAYAGDRIEFEFINPSADPDPEVREELYKTLYKQGLRPTDLNIKEEDGISQKVVWPCAIVNYRGIEIPLQLLKGFQGLGAKEMLNSSIEALEFEFANAIKKLVAEKQANIAFIEGHGELDKFETADIMGSLREYYHVERIRLDGKINILTSRTYQNDSTTYAINNYDAVIIAAPDSALSEKDRYIIDQFFMHGGKVVWLLNAVDANMDSLQNSEVTMALPKDLGLTAQLFDYGVRVNPDLIQDLQAAPIPIVTGRVGNRPKTSLFPWFFYPLLLPEAQHPIVKNLDVVKAEFCSTIDFVGSQPLKKTVLLSSSPYTKVSRTPLRVSLNMVSFEPPKEQFSKGRQPVAVMLEGKFKSAFPSTHLQGTFVNRQEIRHRDESKETKMVVISDGDLIKNEINSRTNEYYLLGFDRYSQQLYANKEFFLNTMNYLLDDSGVMLSNTKTFKLRLLDTTRIEEEKVLWQSINMIAPMLFIILIGLGVYFWRRNKYLVKK